MSSNNSLLMRSDKLELSSATKILTENNQMKTNKSYN